MTIHFSSSLLITCSLAVSANAQTLDDVIDEKWAAGSYWDDGKAEVATYDGISKIYGKDRPHQHHLITVSEDFNTDYNVKADWPYGEKPVLPVLKQNQVATIETKNYPYHYMASVFFERGNLENCVKLTVTSQEWCGITTKEFAMQGKPEITYMSYWDGQGTGTNDLAGYSDSNTVFQEELPLLVRTLKHTDGLTATLNLYPNQTYSRVNPDVRPSPATLTVTQPADLPKKLDDSRDADKLWEVTIESEKTMKFLVTKDFPQTLVFYDFGDGRSYHLKETKRWAYWENNS